MQAKPVFDFVILSHAHSDHGQGLKKLMSHFGARYFWYPKSTEACSLASLIRFAQRSHNVQHHQSIDDTKILPDFGDTTLRVLWPRYDQIDVNENNNSIVLSATYGDVTLMLTGDTEGEVWEKIADQIPDTTRMFKVPHHGSVNGTFLNGNAPWLDECPNDAQLAISSHVRPFSHPDDEVVDEFRNRNMAYFRTDEHYHVSFTTDGSDLTVKYSHV